MIGVSQAREEKAVRAQVAKWENADTDEVLPQQVTYYDLSAHHGRWHTVHWDRVTWGALALGAVVFWAWGQNYNAQLIRAHAAELRAELNETLKHPETVALAALPQSLAPANSRRVSVSFSDPVPGATVGSTMTVRGTIQGAPEDKHLWLVTRRDPRLGFWPKERIVPSDEERFEQTTWDVGADGHLSICIVATTAAETAQFDEWLAKGDRDDEWPSVKLAASSNVLGCQDVTLAKSSLD